MVMNIFCEVNAFENYEVIDVQKKYSSTIISLSLLTKDIGIMHMICSIGLMYRIYTQNRCDKRGYVNSYCQMFKYQKLQIYSRKS